QGSGPCPVSRLPNGRAVGSEVLLLLTLVCPASAAVRLPWSSAYDQPRVTATMAPVAPTTSKRACVSVSAAGERPAHAPAGMVKCPGAAAVAVPGSVISSG